ncbi:MAG: hypothetical protein M3P38_04630 [Chloroflexota bacterium]|nr:hypothetical protein [Chloroflexota bacterium]
MKLFKQPVRFLSIFAFVLSAVLLGNGGTAAAANPLLCFSGTTDPGGFHGTCTLTATGATLVTTDNDTDPNNAYAGVYYEVSSLSGLLIGDVTNVSFTYSCADTTGATNCVTGGSPRLSIPIDTNGDGITNSYAFIDAANCGQTGHATGTVDLSCPVFFGGTLYTNWAAFVTAHPTYRIATDTVSFVIVDQPFRGTVSNVQLGQNVTTAKDKCKNGGWQDMTRADDTSFKNQGDCIQYVNTGK